MVISWTGIEDDGDGLGELHVRMGGAKEIRAEKGADASGQGPHLLWGEDRAHTAGAVLAGDILGAFSLVVVFTVVAHVGVGGQHGRRRAGGSGSGADGCSTRRIGCHFVGVSVESMVRFWV